MSGTIGIFSLGDFQIGAAAVQYGSAVEGLGGASAVTLDARLAYGSGGTTAIVVVQTSLSQGATWIDVARFDFSTAGDEKTINLSGTVAQASPYTSTALGSEGGVNGCLGDRFRALVTSTGAYTGSTVASVRMSVR